MFYIFNTEQEALDYDEYVSAMKNYTGNRTKNWANPRKHPTEDLWAIIPNPQFPHQTATAVELDETWTPSEPV